ncbi:DUF2130 domain-containing protein [Mycoplasmopsis sturni]|uniref:DUF2130 domain-containing protein n=1 Tax=Mycoplasmopsis sturni TaxID=39047 RepID=UPI0005651166|nr:DUF2130 domain-containing protein [Mycoplasmopsis sturni]
MEKYVQARILDSKNLIIELLEEAKVGDKVDLKTLINIDFRSLSDQMKKIIDQEVENKIKERIKKEQENWIIQKNWEINDLNTKSKNEKEKLLNELENSKKNQEKDLEIEKAKWQEEYRKESEENKIEIETLKIQVETLKDEKQKNDQRWKERLESVESNKEQVLQFEKLKWQEEYREESSKNKIEIETLKNQVETLKDEKQKNDQRWEEKLEDITKKHSEQLKQTREDTIELAKGMLKELQSPLNNRTTKMVGEDLENWLQNQFDNTFKNHDHLTSIEMHKATKSIKGTKPDFYIDVYDQEFHPLENKPSNIQSITRIVVEAKNKQTEEGTKKNADFIKKLIKDTENYEGNYAILVTELEPNHEFAFYQWPDNPAIFICRPEFFVPLVTFLSRISRRLFQIKSKILGAEAQVKFIEKFTEFYELLINETKKKIQKEYEDINKKLQTIENSTQAIKKSINAIVNDHLNKAIEKLDQINNFLLIEAKQNNNSEQKLLNLENLEK